MKMDICFLRSTWLLIEKSSAARYYEFEGDCYEFGGYRYELGARNYEFDLLCYEFRGIGYESSSGKGVFLHAVANCAL